MSEMMFPTSDFSSVSLWILNYSDCGVHLLHSRLLTIAGFYRPPNSSPDVFKSLHSVLSSLRRQNFSNLVLCGDFNIDLRYSRPNDSLSLLQLDFQLTQVINEPTRVSPSSSSMIDLIFLSNPTTLVSCGTEAPLANSDHHSVAVTINVSSKPFQPKPPKKQVWLYSQTNISLATQLLKALPVATAADDTDLFW